MMIEAGIDPKTVQTRIGHADISTTMNIYTHCTKTMDQGAANAIDKILFA
jgi:site-specific recombinase XerD